MVRGRVSVSRSRMGEVFSGSDFMTRKEMSKGTGRAGGRLGVRI